MTQLGCRFEGARLFERRIAAGTLIGRWRYESELRLDCTYSPDCIVAR
jgi:hypothetical protein